MPPVLPAKIHPLLALPAQLQAIHQIEFLPIRNASVPNSTVPPAILPLALKFVAIALCPHQLLNSVTMVTLWEETVVQALAQDRLDLHAISVCFPVYVYQILAIS